MNKEAHELLMKAWHSNADKMEYMIIGTPELDRLSKVNEYISKAINILKSNP